MIKNNLFLIFILFFLTTNCGFKVLDTSQANNFSIKSIFSSGEKRINYKIKNYLIINTKKNSQSNLIVNLSTKKNKTIKEKNIKNEVSKYSIELTAFVDFNLLEKNLQKSFSLTAKESYIVGGNYSTTLTNEKKAIEIIVDKIAEDILERIGALLNDI